MSKEVTMQEFSDMLKSYRGGVEVRMERDSTPKKATYVTSDQSQIELGYVEIGGDNRYYISHENLP